MKYGMNSYLKELDFFNTSLGRRKLAVSSTVAVK